MKYIVIKAHRSEFPVAITFNKGDLLVIGEEYVGQKIGTTGIFVNLQSNKRGGYLSN